ncbi:MAG TPA: short-chain dehydrogenase/reductase, partial [Muricauda sp.]|nr:short-chain dehydrogenase/reductase [Allomuricauda sp.]
MSKTIFITGASKGFGKLWAEAFLKRGDRVIATARKITDLDDLIATYGDLVFPYQMDVNNRAEVFKTVEDAANVTGNIDVLINN